MQNLMVLAGFSFVGVALLIHIFFKSYVTLLIFVGNMGLVVLTGFYSNNGNFFKSFLYSLMATLVALYIGLLIQFLPTKGIVNGNWSNLPHNIEKIIKYSLFAFLGLCLVKAILYGV